MVRGRGYIQGIPDIEKIVVGTDERGTPILVKNIGHVTLGPISAAVRLNWMEPVKW